MTRRDNIHMNATEENFSPQFKTDRVVEGEGGRWAGKRERDMGEERTTLRFELCINLNFEDP